MKEINMFIPFLMMISYIICVVLLSYRASFSKKAKAEKVNQSFEDYYTAGKSMPAIIVGLLTIVTFYSGTTFTGRVGFCYNYGFVAITSIISCSMVGIIMYFLSEKIWPISKKYHLSTLSDFMELRYQTKWIKLLIACTILVFNIVWLITEIKTLGMIVNVASNTKISIEIGSIIAFSIIIFYVITGGVRSVAAVDSFSAILMLFGSVITVFYIAFHYYDGNIINIFSEVQKIAPEKIVFDTKGIFSGPYWISSIIMSGICMMVYPSNYMSICLAKDVKSVKKSALLASLSGIWLVVFVIFAYSALGLSNSDLVITNPEESLLLMINHSGNAFIMGLVTTFILAATLGTLDSTLISLSGIISNDIFINIKKIKSKEKCIGYYKYNDTKENIEKNGIKEVRLTRIIIFILGLIALILSQFEFPLMVIMVNYATNGLVQIVPLVVGGLYWKKATSKGAATALISGVSSYILMEYFKINIGGYFLSFPALLINIIVFIVVSKKTFDPNDKTEHNIRIMNDFFDTKNIDISEE
ncbi:sodium:solute symporter family protein [Peptacetobacter sp.]|uniref:sodium:solute symporter family protein n=1 Tax=Peptacetobacter sp. TaxID=2991975 RepID=UPI00261A04A4|nr:sodium:solute symporter family protein [Peptacetobacter sp.]